MELKEGQGRIAEPPGGVLGDIKGSAVLDAWWGRRRQEVGPKMGQGFLESAC